MVGKSKGGFRALARQLEQFLPQSYTGRPPQGFRPTLRRATKKGVEEGKVYQGRRTPKGGPNPSPLPQLRPSTLTVPLPSSLPSSALVQSHTGGFKVVEEALLIDGETTEHRKPWGESPGQRGGRQRAP